MLLHQGRGDLMTVTGVDTLASYPRLRENGPCIDGAARACDAVARLFDTGESHPEVYALLSNELALLDGEPSRAGRANQLAFRLKLLLAAGLSPQLAACAACGEGDHLWGFSGSAGGVVCVSCQASGFPLDEAAHSFLVEALGRPLASTPDADERSLRQAERAIGDTLEHHAHVRLKPAAAA
jgi:DNA repair protein RecO (recombination protein O)